MQGTIAQLEAHLALHLVTQRLLRQSRALHGINLAEMIREARATLTGKGTDQVKEARKTDFSALTASFQWANSWISSLRATPFANWKLAVRAL
ncbi:hypothetical protein LI321_23025, partial [Lacrimispora saccharolytica]|nr:hypothetical protein [Lacrimispora saccharolytica]